MEFVAKSMVEANPICILWLLNVWIWINRWFCECEALSAPFGFWWNRLKGLQSNLHIIAMKLFLDSFAVALNGFHLNSMIFKLLAFLCQMNKGVHQSTIGICKYISILVWQFDRSINSQIIINVMCIHCQLSISLYPPDVIFTYHSIHLFVLYLNFCFVVFL